MGIANPVTRETYGSGTHYHMQLAKQLAGILQTPLEVKYLILHQHFPCVAEFWCKCVLAVVLCLFFKASGFAAQPHIQCLWKEYISSL